MHFRQKSSHILLYYKYNQGLAYVFFPNTCAGSIDELNDEVNRTSIAIAYQLSGPYLTKVEGSRNTSKTG